jgi:uncharacterized protein (DUF427 family)
MAGVTGFDERSELMATAEWQGVVIAESEETILVEGNQYFPPESVKAEFLVPSELHTVCGWKGTASYYDIKVGDQVNENAAWYYPDVLPAAEPIKGYVAFWNGVNVEATTPPVAVVEVP